MVLSFMCLAKDERSDCVLEVVRLSFILHVGVKSVKRRDTDTNSGCFCFVVLFFFLQDLFCLIFLFCFVLFCFMVVGFILKHKAQNNWRRFLVKRHSL